MLMTEEQTFVTAKVAAQKWDLSPQWVVRLAKSGKITGHKEETPLGDYWAIDQASLDRYMENWRARKPGRPKKQKAEGEHEV